MNSIQALKNIKDVTNKLPKDSTSVATKKLETAININGTSFNGSKDITTSKWGTSRNITVGNTAKSVDGSNNISWSIKEIGALGSNHNNGYYGMSTPEGNTSDWIRTTTSGIIPYQSGGSSSIGTDSWRFNSIYGNNIYGTLHGNASSASQLATTCSINGTNFNGTGGITTKYWGNGRNFTIGNSTKLVDGTQGVSWSLSEIGAAPASHSHSYLPLSGGTVTGNLHLSNNWMKLGAYWFTISTSAPSANVGDVWVQI
jgi:hypothetical protein